VKKDEKDQPEPADPTLGQRILVAKLYCVSGHALRENPSSAAAARQAIGAAEKDCTFRPLGTGVPFAAEIRR